MLKTSMNSLVFLYLNCTSLLVLDAFSADTPHSDVEASAYCAAFSDLEKLLNSFLREIP